jgi:hypothetical protein
MRRMMGMMMMSRRKMGGVEVIRVWILLIFWSIFEWLFWSEFKWIFASLIWLLLILFYPNFINLIWFFNMIFTGILYCFK